MLITLLSMFVGSNVRLWEKFVFVPLIFSVVSSSVEELLFQYGGGTVGLISMVQPEAICNAEFSTSM